MRKIRHWKIVCACGCTCMRERDPWVLLVLKNWRNILCLELGACFLGNEWKIKCWSSLAPKSTLWPSRFLEFSSVSSPRSRADAGNDIIRRETRSHFHWFRRHHGVRLLGFASLDVFYTSIFFHSQWEVTVARVKYFETLGERCHFNGLFPFWSRQHGEHTKRQRFHPHSKEQSCLLPKGLGG